MEIISNVGALNFRYAGATHHPFPEVRARGFRLQEGAPLLCIEEGDERFLLLDHRREGYRSEAAVSRVEYWESLGPSEGGVCGLFVVGEARRGNPTADPIEGFSYAAMRLSCLLARA
jgi:hypothetical protein